MGWEREMGEKEEIEEDECVNDGDGKGGRK